MLRVVCVDDEEPALQRVVSLCGETDGISETRGFGKPQDALDWVKEHPCDLALLDIRMPDMDGIRLAEKIRELQPGAEIVFVTGHAEHAVEAWAVHARGYVLKPVTPERLREEVEYVLSLRPGMTPGRPSAHIEVKTFGSFDVLVDGEPVHFRRAKAKELLAYLVEKQGQSITREKAFLALWEGRPYDRPGQKQLDVILRSLRGTLDEYGIGGILSVRRGAISVVPRMFSCDMYRFVLGDAAAIGEYRGEYMTAYSWASLREAYLERRIENLKDPAVSGSADSADPQRR